ncbi:MAG: hypothetical protein NDJ90_15055, partial [Oligoflexia bacterium]|nr:hypothetical protein [Oligoflexia bacterium]
KKQPARGKFELARLVAQTWSPCELQKLQAAQAWDPVLECLEVRESGACNVGTYSEAGWAVSSVVAATIAPPGCTLPALTRTDVVACLKKAPFAASASSGTVVMEAAGANRSVASEEPVTKGGQQ